MTTGRHIEFFVSMSIYHLAISLMLAVVLISNCQGGRYLRQIRSHGCGKNPVLKIVSEVIKDRKLFN